MNSFHSIHGRGLGLTPGIPDAGGAATLAYAGLVAMVTSGFAAAEAKAKCSAFVASLGMAGNVAEVVVYLACT